jgi:hypothetical protein
LTIYLLNLDSLNLSLGGFKNLRIKTDENRLKEKAKNEQNNTNRDTKGNNVKGKPPANNSKNSANKGKE